jgi:hypothetical protein
VKITESPDLFAAVEKACIHYRDQRLYKEPYFLYSPYEFEEKELVTSAGIVKVSRDTTLPDGTIYVLAEEIR